MITLKNLRWDNCFSYGEKNILNLSEHTITQIVGTNGVGKSSIPLIIEEVLYNKNSKGIKKAELANRYLGESYKICLEFSKDEDEFMIETTRKGNAIKIKLVKNGEDISSHTATNTFKTIQEEIIGIDFKTFSQLVYQNTNASLQFLTATDTARKKFLIDLLGLEEYVTYFELFKDVLKNVSTEQSKLEGSIQTVTSWLETNKLDEEVQPYKIQSLPEVSESLKARESDLVLSLDKINSTNAKIRKNNQYKELLNKINIYEINNIQETEYKNTNDLQKVLGQITGTVNAAKKEILKMKDLHGICPTCSQIIDEDKTTELVTNNKNIIHNCQSEISRINDEINLIEQQNARYDLKVKKQKEFEDLIRSIDKSLPSDLIDENELRTELELVKNEIKQITDSIKIIAAENQKAEKFNTRLQIILEQSEKFTKELLENTKKLEEVQKQTTNLEILKKAFSTNGLLAYKIENLVKELEELTNNYLAELADGRFTIQFVINNDKLNVEITDNGNIVDILALSSGELARVNTATLLAIRRLMSSISKTKINILFLDEVINVLDEQGREKLVEVLIKEEELNTYLVSHGWTHPLLHKVDVVKKNNISFLEY
jgi:DNA repair exonuclease SbcCD ATPase subunit